MSEEDYEKFTEQAFAGVNEGKFSKTPKMLLNNRMFFRARTMDLADRLGEERSKKLLDGINRWSYTLTARRNASAHGSGGSGNLAEEHEKADRKPGVDVYLTLITRSLLWAVLGKELGMNDEQLDWFVQTQWPVSSRWKEVTKKSRKALPPRPSS